VVLIEELAKMMVVNLQVMDAITEFREFVYQVMVFYGHG
jgi:hypothetical protein